MIYVADGVTYTTGITLVTLTVSGTVTSYTTYCPLTDIITDVTDNFETSKSTGTAGNFGTSTYISVTGHSGPFTSTGVPDHP